MNKLKLSNVIINNNNSNKRCFNLISVQAVLLRGNVQRIHINGKEMSAALHLKCRPVQFGGIFPTEGTGYRVRRSRGK